MTLDKGVEVFDPSTRELIAVIDPPFRCDCGCNEKRYSFALFGEGIMVECYFAEERCITVEYVEGGEG
jgi:hypothetical protein